MHHTERRHRTGHHQIEGTGLQRRVARPRDQGYRRTCIHGQRRKDSRRTQLELQQFRDQVRQGLLLQPLAAHQASRLHAAGCHPAAVVLGSAADTIRPALPPTLPTVYNPRWSQGRATSLQAAVAALPDATGWLFLPIDAVGICLETLQALLAAAAWNPDVPWRPLHRGQKGNLRWLPRPLATALAALPPDARIDDWIAPLASSLDLDDPALLRNANTPADYSSIPPDAFAPDPGPDPLL